VFKSNAVLFYIEGMILRGLYECSNIVSKLPKSKWENIWEHIYILVSFATIYKHFIVKDNLGQIQLTVAYIVVLDGK
jgi:hypothetical protein